MNLMPIYKWHANDANIRVCIFANAIGIPYFTKVNRAAQLLTIIKIIYKVLLVVPKDL